VIFDLETAGLQWLRNELRCYAVLMERSPREWCCGRPDLLGVTRARHQVEVEVKRTIQDFRANARKDFMSRRDTFLHRFPRQFYFLVPEELAEQVRAELPPFAGLLTPPRPMSGGWVHVVAPAPVNSHATRFSLKEMVKVGHLMSNQNVATLLTLARLRRNPQ